MPATCEAGAPALRPTAPPCSLTPPHIPVRRLPASAGSFPTIPRMQAAHRESLRPEALERLLCHVGGGMAPSNIVYVLAILAASWGWDPPETPARPVNPSNLIRIMPAKG